MTDQNQLERDADKIREGIAETAEAIQDRMNPGKMVEDLFTYMKDSDGSLALSTLGRQARDNPMALAMIGAGMAWLMLGNGKDGASSGDASTDRRGDRHAGASWPTTGSATHAARSSEGGEAGGDAGAAQELGDRAKDAMQHAADGARSAAQDVSDRARRLRNDAVDQGDAAADKARSMAERGRRSLAEAMDQEPLVLGAIAVAVGAAIGAMLPNTRLEDETLGEVRENLTRDAGEVVDQAAQSARDIGGKAVDAARSAAETA